MTVERVHKDSRVRAGAFHKGPFWTDKFLLHIWLGLRLHVAFHVCEPLRDAAILKALKSHAAAPLRPHLRQIGVLQNAEAM